MSKKYFPQITIDNEIYYVKDKEAREELKNKADIDSVYDTYPTKTASGTAAYITDGADGVPVRSVSVTAPTDSYRIEPNWYLTPDSPNAVALYDKQYPRTIVLPCAASTTYTINSGLSATLRAASFVAYPEIGSVPTAFSTNVGVSVSITTGADDKFLAVQLFINAEESVTAFATAIEGFSISPSVDWVEIPVKRAGKNIFDAALGICDGRWESSGAPNTGNAARKHTQFLPVVGGESLAWSFGVAMSLSSYALWLDSDCAEIRRDVCAAGASWTLTAPATAAWVSLPAFVTAGQTYQLERGTTATGYAAYTGETVTLPELPKTVLGINTITAGGQMLTVDYCVDPDMAAATKQDKLAGTEGQYVGFDVNGDATAVTPDAAPTANSGKLVTSGGVKTAIDAVQTFAEYVALREEEDRQILFGSIVEAAEDEYDELRSAPIHTAITIGQSVYPRMDNTRLGLNAVKGRTVAFNQLASDQGSMINTYPSGTTATYDSTNKTWTVAGTMGSDGYAYLSLVFSRLTSGHKYLTSYEIVEATGVTGYWMKVGTTTSTPASTKVGNIYYAISNAAGTDKISLWGFSAPNGTAFSVTFKNRQIIDLTAMYGTTLADQIYAMETTQAGAGVAYVRQRLPLDYYAYNAGKLKAPVVSGVSVTGCNLFNKDDGTLFFNAYISNGKIVSNGNNSVAFCACEPHMTYTIQRQRINGDGASELIVGYTTTVNKPTGGDDIYNVQTVTISAVATGHATITTGENATWLVIFLGRSAYKKQTAETVMVQLGNMMTAYVPYDASVWATLSLPSTTLNGVGTAQDVLECVEVAENDYSLVKTYKTETVDLGTLTWIYDSGGAAMVANYTSGLPMKTGSGSNPCICEGYNTEVTPIDFYSTDKAACINNGRRTVQQTIQVRDSAYTDADIFATAMSGVMFAFAVATPTQTTIAEHLTLEEVSAIAQNGGVISAINSNGDIVQPDLTVDTVISRSAS